MKKINILYAYTQIRPRGIWKPTSKLSWSYKTNATTSCCRFDKLWGNTYFIWYIIFNYSITGDRYSRFNYLKFCLTLLFPRIKKKCLLMTVTCEVLIYRQIRGIHIPFGKIIFYISNELFCFPFWIIQSLMLKRR